MLLLRFSHSAVKSLSHDVVTISFLCFGLSSALDEIGTTLGPGRGEVYVDVDEP